MSRPLDAAAPFPGFDGLRLFAALSVLFSHAFLIATGTENDEPLVKLLGHGNIAGLYGVYTFFVISGFLLARSLSQDGSIARFAINRTLRIYPGFIACALVTALLIGAMGSALSWHEYFASDELVGYLASSLSCLCDTTLPGVFAYRDSAGMHTVVNGSLWSLSFEMLSYLLLAIVWSVLRRPAATGIVLALLAALTLAFPAVYKGIASVAYTLPYFAGGVMMFTIRERFGLHARVAAACALALVVAAFLGVARECFAIFGAYLVVYLGSRPNWGSAFAARAGDLSYGVYLFGWPIEQLLKQHLLGPNPWFLMAFAVPLVLVIAAVSLHAVERPALRLKAPMSALVHHTIIMTDPLKRRVAAVASTMALFLVGGAVLTSEREWWYVTQTLFTVAVACAVAAAIAVLLAGAIRGFVRRA